MKINDHERKVLKILAEAWGGDFFYCSFRSISARCGLDRKQVRRACRSLARKGLAQYERGLWTEDGEPAGSGYGATVFGCEAIEGRAAP